MIFPTNMGTVWKQGQILLFWDWGTPLKHMHSTPKSGITSCKTFPELQVETYNLLPKLFNWHISFWFHWTLFDPCMRYRVVQKKQIETIEGDLPSNMTFFRFYIYPFVQVSWRDLINDFNNINECIMTSLNIVAIATTCFPISLICKSVI